MLNTFCFLSIIWPWERSLMYGQLQIQVVQTSVCVNKSNIFWKSTVQSNFSNKVLEDQNSAKRTQILDLFCMPKTEWGCLVGQLVSMSVHNFNLAPIFYLYKVQYSHLDTCFLDKKIRSKWTKLWPWLCDLRWHCWHCISKKKSCF